MASDSLNALVYAIRFEAEGIVSVELRPGDESTIFPPFEAGAHIDLHLGNGLIRNYSLCNDPRERQRYVVAVLNDRASRGGSRYVHEELRVGTRLAISAPRNNFRLHEDASETVLIAGGIGVTPILAMLRRLRAIGRSPHLIHCARSRREAAFVAEVAELSEGRAHWHFDDEQDGVPDFRALLSAYGPAAHYYCCGPAPMLAAYEAACAALGYPNMHLERFAAPVAPMVQETAGGFEIELVRAGRILHVPADKTVLQVMLEAGIDVDYSCEGGVCGTCEVGVIAGEVDHRDFFFPPSERAAARSMMVCVSRCRSGRLVLDV